MSVGWVLSDHARHQADRRGISEAIFRLFAEAPADPQLRARQHLATLRVVSTRKTGCRLTGEAGSRSPFPGRLRIDSPRNGDIWTPSSLDVG